jgi:hypothetical protein
MTPFCPKQEDKIMNCAHVACQCLAHVGRQRQNTIPAMTQVTAWPYSVTTHRGAANAGRHQKKLAGRFCLCDSRFSR